MYFGSVDRAGLHVWARQALRDASERLGSWLEVRLHTDGSLELEDDGSSPTSSDALERACAELQVPSIFGHLCCLCGAAARLEILVRQRGEDFALIYVNQALVSRSLADLHDCAPLDHEGMRIRAWPDPTLFTHVQLDAGELAELAESIAGVNAGARVSFEDRRRASVQTFVYPRGLLDWIDAMAPDHAPREPIYLVASQGQLRVEAAFRLRRSVAPSHLRMWLDAADPHRLVSDATLAATLEALGIRGWAPIGVVLVRASNRYQPEADAFVAEQLAQALRRRIDTDPDFAARFIDP